MYCLVYQNIPQTPRATIADTSLICVFFQKEKLNKKPENGHSALWENDV